METGSCQEGQSQRGELPCPPEEPGGPEGEDGRVKHSENGSRSQP